MVVIEKSGRELRNAAIRSRNTVQLSYSVPDIKQVIVTEHPSISGLRLLKIIGSNYGSIKVSEYPDVEYEMRVNSIPLDGGQPKGHSYELRCGYK